MAKGLHPGGIYDRTVINRATEGAAEAERHQSVIYTGI